MFGKLANSFWATAEYAWYPILLLLSTPWFLNTLGAEQYGSWMLMNATIGLGGVLTVGTGAATIKFISASKDRNPSTLAEPIRVSLGIAIVGGGALALIVACVFFLGGTSLLSRMGSVSNIRWIGCSAALLIWIEQIDSVFSSSMKGFEKFNLSAIVEMSAKTTQVLTALLAATWLSSVEAVFVALIVTAVARLIAKMIILRKVFHIRGIRPSLKSASTIFHWAKWGWLQGIGGVLFNAGDRLIVGSILGATSLAYYSIALQIAVQIHSIGSAFLSVVFPRASRILATDAQASLRRLIAVTLAGNFALSSALAAFAWLLGPPLIIYWTKNTQTPAVPLLYPLILCYWLLSLNVAPHYMLLGMGRVRFVGLISLVSGVIGVIGAFTAIHYLGITGAPAGRAAYAVASLALLVPILGILVRGNPVRQATSGST